MDGSEDAQSAALPGSQESSAANVHTWTSTDMPAFGSGEEFTSGPESRVPFAVAVLPAFRLFSTASRPGWLASDQPW